MARDFFISGECLVTVKGRSDSAIAALSQLGLPLADIRVTPNFRHRDINVDAWGEAPADVQWLLADLNVRMALLHIDRAVLDVCLSLSMGGGQALVGQFARAGTRLGNNLPRFAPGNNYIGLNLSSPIAGKPWRFGFAYLTGPPMEFPLGVEKSVVTLNWRVVPYTQDPAGIIAGLIFGANGYALWDHINDN